MNSTEFAEHMNKIKLLVQATATLKVLEKLLTKFHKKLDEEK